MLLRHLNTHAREQPQRVPTRLCPRQVMPLESFQINSAFDKVKHERLLLKLKAYGVTGQFNSITWNFITCTTTVVRSRQ